MCIDDRVTGCAKHYLNKKTLIFTVVQLLKTKRPFSPFKFIGALRVMDPAWLDSQRQLLESQWPPSR